MRNLAIARAGEKSRHLTWLSDPSKKNFDLLVAYYGNTPGKWAEGSDAYDHRPGPKYPWFEEFLRSSPGILEYDAVWLVDDDIEGDTATVADAFDLFHAGGFWLAQPALTAGSVIGYPMMQCRPGVLYRYVGFVEEQMPIFSGECLRQVRHTLGESKSGWGLGIAWANVLGHPKDRLGVIDAAPMRHLRPLQSGELYTSVLPTLGKDPMRELSDMREKYGDDMRMETHRSVPLDRDDPLTPVRKTRQRR